MGKSVIYKHFIFIGVGELHALYIHVLYPQLKLPCHFQERKLKSLLNVSVW